MTIVNEARSALQQGASTVLSTIQRRPKSKRRLMSFAPQALVKRVNRRFVAKRNRPARFVLPITLAVGATAVSVTASILLSRYLRAKRATDETEYVDVTDQVDGAEHAGHAAAEPEVYA